MSGGLVEQRLADDRNVGQAGNRKRLEGLDLRRRGDLGQKQAIGEIGQAGGEQRDADADHMLRQAERHGERGVKQAEHGAGESAATTTPGSRGRRRRSNTEQLYKSTFDLEKRLKEMPDFQDVATDLQINSPQIDVRMDRDKAAALGLSAEQVEDALSSAYGNRMVSTFCAPSNQYKVIVELEPEHRFCKP